MNYKGSIVLFWFRRDLRLEDNTALYYALSSGYKVLPLFIFDSLILDRLEKDDSRLSYIHGVLLDIHEQLHKFGSCLLVEVGSPEAVFKKLVQNYRVHSVYANADYEPYALKRDMAIKDLLQAQKIEFKSYKDHVLFEPGEILKKNGNPYTVFTPYLRRWSEMIPEMDSRPSEKHLNNLLPLTQKSVPSLNQIGFKPGPYEVPPFNLNSDLINHYHELRDFPGLGATTRLGTHLRFGTVSIREISNQLLKVNKTLLNQLVWREFFIQILFYFPQTIDRSFRPAYDQIEWTNNEDAFQRWCLGLTGFPMVDAGMRELNQTGYMHNRVRMLTASFLCKHLLIDWRWGESYFASILMDYEQASNVGNWQWASGSGCDAAPYFRVFNPEIQRQKFDPDFVYINKWIPEYNSPDYPNPMIEHDFARKRALEFYKQSLRY